MSDSIGQKIVTFLASEFARKEHRQCIRLELSHAQVGFRGDVLRSWDRKETPDDFELSNVERLASEILQIALDEAENFPTGRQRFVLRTEQFLPGGRAKHTFVIAPEYTGSDDDEVGGMSGDETLALPGVSGAGGRADRSGHPQTKIGTFNNVLSMQMRHNERLMQMQSQTFQGSLQAALRQNQMLVDENMQLRKERAEMAKELETMRTASDERELRALAQVAADERKDKVVGKMLQLAPVVAAKIAGAGAVPGAPSSLSILVSELASSLSPEQFQRIAGALSMEQKILLGEAIKVAKQSEPPPESAKAKPAPAPTTPDDSGTPPPINGS